MNLGNTKMPTATELFFFSFSMKSHLWFGRYEQAKNISQDLERQAAQVHEEAKRAGDKAVEIYASVTQLTPVDSEALEVRGLRPACAGLRLSRPSPRHSLRPHPPSSHTPQDKNYSDRLAPVTGTGLRSPPADSLVMLSPVLAMLTELAGGKNPVIINSK